MDFGWSIGFSEPGRSEREAQPVGTQDGRELACQTLGSHDAGPHCVLKHPDCESVERCDPPEPLLGPAWTACFAIPSFILFLKFYQAWKRHGGNDYVAPVPGEDVSGAPLPAAEPDVAGAAK